MDMGGEFIELVFVEGGRQARGLRQPTPHYPPKAWNDMYLPKCC